MSRRRRHLSRTAIGLLLAVTLWVVAVAAALWVMDLPGSRAWLARKVAERLTAAAGLPVGVAEVQFSLVPLRLVARGLTVGPPTAPLVRVDAAEALVGDVLLANREIGIDQLRLRGVVVDVEGEPVARGGAGGGWIRVLVRQLEVQDLQVKRVALPSGVVFQASNVEARWTGTRRQPISSAVVSAGAVTVQVPGLQPISGSVMAWGRRTERGWEVGKVRARGTGWSLNGGGGSTGSGVVGEGDLDLELAELERTIGIGAGLAGPVHLRWKGSVKTGVKVVDFRLDGAVSAPHVEVAGLHFGKLAGEVHASPDGLEGSVTEATFAGGTLEASYSLGSFGPPWRHRVAMQGQGVDVGRFLLQLGASDAGIAARARVNADVAWDGGAFKAGYGTGIADLRAADGPVPVAGRLVFSLAHDGALRVVSRDATLAGGTMLWEGALTLGTWVPTWKVQGEKLPVAAIATLLRGWIGVDVVPPQLTGEAAVDIGLAGPFRDLTVEGNVALAPVAFGPVNADGIEATFRAGQGVLSVDPALVYVGSGRVSGRGELRYGTGGGLELELAGRGVPLARMVAWGGVRAPLAGVVAFDGELTGTLDSPAAQADVRLAGVALAGVPFGDGAGRVRLADRVVSVSKITAGPFSASAEVDLGKREAVVDATLSGFGLDALSSPLARLMGGALDCTLHGAFGFDSPAGRLEVTSARGARGWVQLDAQGVRFDVERPQVWTIAGDLRRESGGFRGNVDYGVLSWRRLAQDLAGAEVPVEGRMSGQAEIRLAPPGPAHIEGVVNELLVAVEGEEATLAEPGRFVIDGGAIRIDGVNVTGKRSSLVASAARANDGSLSGTVSGELPAALLALVWRDSRPSGRVAVQGEISGTDSAPRFEGTARVTDGALRIPGLAEPATRINGVLEFTPEAIKFDGVTFAMLAGTGVCDGRILLNPRLGFDLELLLDSVRWPLITGLTPILTGDVRLVGELQDLSLSGKAVLKHTVFRRDLDLQRLVLEQARAPERLRATEGSPMTLNLTVDVPSTLEIDTPLARLVAKGEIRVVGSTARYGVLGRLEALPGAELEFAGNRYELDRGTVTFTSADRIESHLDVLARTTVQTFEVTVGLNGTLDRLTPTFTSNPPLPEMDVISLVSTGRRADAAGQAGTSAVASSLFTDQLTGVVTNRARTLLDVDQMRVDPFAATQSGNPAARLTVVKQLNRDWSVTVSTNLAANREEVVTSRWRLAPGVFLEANREQDGSYSMEVKWQRRY